MTNMVIAISNWGSNSLDWLEHGICQGSCSQSNTLSVLSNIQVWTSGKTPDVDPSPGPEPEPTPIDPVEPLETLYYANRCGNRMD